MARKKISPPGWIICSLALTFSILIAGCLGRASSSQPPTPTPPAAPPTQPPDYPDLAILAVQIEAAVPEDGECIPSAGLYRLHVTIANRGAAASGAFSVRANEIVQSLPAGLQPGESADFFFPYETVRPAIQVRADAPETSLENNTFYDLLSLPQLPAACLFTPTPASHTLAPLHTLEGHTAAVRAVAFSPDGKLVASGSVDETMRLWTADPPAPLRVMQGHTFPILAVRFTPNGSQLVTGSMDGIIRTWQVANSRQLSAMRGHAGWVRTLDITPNGQWLISGADDYTLRIWRMASSTLLQTIDEGMTAINQVAFGPDSRTYAWAEESGVVRLRILNEDGLKTFKATAMPATSLAFVDGGARLAVGYADGSIRIWEIAGGALEQVFKSGASGITALAVSPDGRWLITAQEDGLLAGWDLSSVRQSGAPAVVYVGGESRANAVAYSPLGSLVVSGSEDGTLQVWPAPFAAAP